MIIKRSINNNHTFDFEKVKSLDFECKYNSKLTSEMLEIKLQQH